MNVKPFFKCLTSICPLIPFAVSACPITVLAILISCDECRIYLRQPSKVFLTAVARSRKRWGRRWKKMTEDVKLMVLQLAVNEMVVRMERV